MFSMLIFFEVTRDKFYYKKWLQSITIKKFIQFVANSDCKFMFFSDTSCEIPGDLTKWIEVLENNIS